MEYKSSYVPRVSVTLDDLINDMGGVQGYWEDTIYEEDETPVPKLIPQPVLEKKQLAELDTKGHLEIDTHKEESELNFYKNKLAEQLDATREILGNFQLISRRSKITESLAERYKGDLSRHKEYLSHLLDQQTAALSAYKNKIVLLDKERSSYKLAYRKLRKEYENFQEEAQEYFRKYSQKQPQEEIEEYKAHMRKLEEYAKLQIQKKEFFKTELRKRLLQEESLQERENAYLEKITQLKQIYAQLSTTTTTTTNSTTTTTSENDGHDNLKNVPEITK